MMYPAGRFVDEVQVVAVPFKGTNVPKDVIMYAVFFYVSYAMSCRDLEKIPAERRVVVDDANPNRRVVEYASALSAVAQQQKALTGLILGPTVSAAGAINSWFSRRAAA